MPTQVPTQKKNTHKKRKERSFTVINDDDPNDSFEVIATDVNDAQFKALEHLGWWVSSN